MTENDYYNSASDEWPQAPDPDLPYVRDEQGNKRFLGALDSAPDHGGFMMFGTTFPVLRKNEIVPFREEPDETYVPILDQNGRGACVAFATTGAVLLDRWKQGMAFIALDPWSLYAQACRGVDRGSTLEDCCKIAQSVGIPRTGLFPEKGISPRDITPELKADAANQQIENVFWHDSFESVLTAIVLRLPTVFTLDVGGGFNSLDSDHVPRSTPGYGNHGVRTYNEIAKRSNGELLFGMANSWSKSWGAAGYCRISESFFNRQPQLNFFSIVSVKFRLDDPLRPPVAPVYV